MRILVIAARFNELITKALLEGALDTFKEAGLKESEVKTVWVPGSFEIPAVAAKAAKSGGFDAVVTLGCVIRGETPHFDYVAGEAASGLMKLSVETSLPIIFGILTTDTMDQALARSGLKGGNKGRDAASAALSMIKTMSKLEEMKNQ